MAERRGMVVKNVTEGPLKVRLETRVIRLDPQEETSITAEEVRDAAIRECLQMRTLAVVRPWSEGDADGPADDS